MPPRACYVATEFFAWGRHGGIGKATREIASGVAERGFDVHTVVPRGRGQRRVEELDGVTVHSHALREYPFSGHVYREIDADIYHSEDPSWGTLLAMNSVERSIHVVTAQNPRTGEDWRRVQGFYPVRRRLYNLFIQPGVEASVRRADAVFCQARFVTHKTRELYGLESDPGFLPNPVEIPGRNPRKSATPAVCFLGRLDGEKSPEKFFSLAESFPGVRFTAVGRAHDPARDRRLRERYGGASNLELAGFLTGEDKARVLEDSWVLVNTSVHECLPVSFLEAAAHRCAILSPHDPDGFATSFGYHVAAGDYVDGLRWLLEGERWRERGERGYRYVSAVHEKKKVIDRHVEVYESLLRK
jgi:glycosyltransferase involved in cell wall biosynthesis